MDDREKLIEMLRDIDGETGFQLLGYHDIISIADYLIAHGVTVKKKFRPKNFQNST